MFRVINSARVVQCDETGKLGIQIGKTVHSMGGDVPDGLPSDTRKTDNVSIAWDGRTAGKPKINLWDNYTLYKISNKTPSVDDLLTGSFTMYNGWSMPFNDPQSYFDELDGGYIFWAYDDDPVVIVVFEPSEYASEPGIYVIMFDPTNYVQTVEYTERTGELTTLDTKFLPEGTPYDTRRDLEATYSGDTVVLPYNDVKIADSVDFDPSKAQSVSVYISGSTVGADVPLTPCKWEENSPLFLYVENGGGFNFDNGVLMYIANDEEAYYWWDSDEPNPYTTGLYIMFRGLEILHEPDESLYIECVLKYQEGELRTIAPDCLPNILPFGKTEQDAMFWDGDTQGITQAYDDYNNYYFYKFSDCIPTINDLKDGLTCMVPTDSGDTYTYELHLEDMNVYRGVIFAGDSPLVIVSENSVGADMGNGFSFAESGMYFMQRNNDTLGIHITIPNYTFTVVEPIDADFMPNGYPRAVKSTVPYIDATLKYWRNYTSVYAGCDHQLVAGNAYFVDWNGDAYTLIAREYYDYIYLGNMSKCSSSLDNTGEPFCIKQRSNGGSAEVYIDKVTEGEPVIITVTVYGDGETTKKMSSELLPENYDVIFGLDGYITSESTAITFLRGNYYTFYDILVTQGRAVRVAAIDRSGDPRTYTALEVTGAGGSTGYYFYVNFFIPSASTIVRYELPPNPKGEIRFSHAQQL